MDTVRLAYDLDRDTAVAAAVAFHAIDPASTSAGSAARRRNIAAGLVFAGLFGLMYLRDRPVELVAGLGAFAGLLFAGVNLLSWKRRQSTAFIVRKLLNDPAGAAALGRRTIEFNRKGLVLDTDYSREEYTWSAVLRVKQTPDFLLLTLPGPRPLAIPKSAFPTAAEFDEFADDLRATVGVTM